MRNNDIEISIVVPVYNSSQTLDELTARIIKVLEKLVPENFELIFVNDGSTDSSWQVLTELTYQNSKLTTVNLTKNFGQHNALMCGLSKAIGKYIVTIDDDLQTPPEEIPKLYDEIKKGNDVVYGIHTRKGWGNVRNLGSNIVQYVFRKTFKTKIKITSFRIIRRDILELVLSYNKSFTYIDGLLSWYSSKIGNVHVEHIERKTGKSGYTFGKLLVLALNMLTNFTIAPLQFASILGLIFSLLGLFIGLLILIIKLVKGIEVSGYASIIISVTMLSGVQLLTVGILGEYIGRIHINISKRPQYAVREIVKSPDHHKTEEES